MKTTLLRKTVAFTLIGTAISVAPALHAGSNHENKKPKGLVSADQKRGAQRAADIIGNEVKNTSGERLGKISDLVISSKKGRIVYALVSSGGVAGLGDTVRAVPFSVLSTDYDAKGALTLDITLDRWNSAPPIEKNNLDALATPERSQQLHALFGREKDAREFRRLFEREVKEPTGQLLVRATELDDREIINQGRDVGEVEDVLVDVERGQASLLIEAEDDYVGSDQKFVVSFEQVSAGYDDDEAVFLTGLSPEDFRRATPADSRDSRDDLKRYPYVWGGYGFGTAPAYPVGATDHALSEDRITGTGQRVSVEAVREALRADKSLSERARRATIEQREDKLVVTGTVPSKEIKERVEDRLEQIATGWKIENRLVVASND